jgi:hypothetical protein
VTGPRRWAVLIAAVAAAIALAVVVVATLGGPQRRTETGVVVDVRATGLTNVQGFSIRTADGRTVDFRIGTLENAASFPAGHLGSHRVDLRPIRVTYVEQDGGLVAIRLDDAT